MARPISAPYSNWMFRSDSGEPSNPDRFASTTNGRLPLAALIALRRLLRRLREQRAGGELIRAVRRQETAPRDVPRLDPDDDHRVTAEVRVHHHRGVRVGHPGPALQGLVVLVGDRVDHRPDVERLLPVLVRLRREDLPDRGERAVRVHVREGLHVPVQRIGRLRPPRVPLAGRGVGVVVVREQDLGGRGEIRRPVLRLAVRAHHPVVAAEAEVVLRRDTAGVVQRHLPGQHHGAVRRHDQDALGVRAASSPRRSSTAGRRR